VPQSVTSSAPLLVKAQGADPAKEQSRFVLPPILESLRNPIGLASAPFRSERVAGRVFFADLETPRAEMMSLTELVGREIDTSLEQMHVTQRLTEVATGEERLRVARDLHDGVLQSLTGIRLEIRAVASALDGVAESGRDRLFAVERALAIEQRELRMFIGDLGPPRRDPERSSLAARLETLQERLALEWKVPVAIQLAPGVITVPEPLVEAVPMMVHEAVVNALKPAQPSRVSVTVDGGPDEIRVAVADDGRGFPFRGRFDHVELIGMRAGPRSLLERVTSLGGRMTIDSADTGSRVEMHLSL
jgi:signal transduction histidine kinase